MSNPEVKELLGKQLVLLAKQSETAVWPELNALTQSMVEVASLHENYGADRFSGFDMPVSKA